NLLQSIRDAGGIERIHWRRGHLYYALSQRIPDYFRDAGLHVRRWKSGYLHTVLAREGAACRRARHPGAVFGPTGDCGGRESISTQSGPHDSDTQKGMETGTWDDLAGGSKAAHGKLRTRQSKSERAATKGFCRSDPGQSTVSVAAAEAGSPASHDR